MSYQDKPAPSAAPAPSTSSAPDDRGNAFRAVEGGGESVAGGKLLVAAYAVVWVILLLVIVRIFLRQTQVARDLERLEDQLREKSEKDQKGGAPRAGGSS